VVRSIVDGSVINFDGLAETIRAARMRIDVGEQAALPASQGRQDFTRGGRQIVQRSASERPGNGWNGCKAGTVAV
jgi:hypothetical protein